MNDTRMFEKFGQSLAKVPGAEVHLIGQSSSQKSEKSSNIFFHRLPNFKRLSFKRISAQWKIYKIIHKLKPEVIIITTAELLPLMAICKILFKAEIYYDVQENYFKNITSQPTYPALLRPMLAYPLRLLEKLSTRFISHYFLAERSYATEMTFLAGKHTVLENKFKPNKHFESWKTFPVTVNPVELHLLYSGTISEVYGMWEAIALADRLFVLNNKTKLTIIGFCPQETTYRKIRKNIAEKPYINLIGGNKLVPHPEIIKAINHASVGLLPYRDNPSTRDCMPTKLFEYLANCLPVLIPENPLWEAMVQQSKAGFSVNFTEPDALNILNRLTSGSFYPGGQPKHVFWQEEERKLLSFFNEKLLNS
ncbi:glycosyltransferase [Adhaeribacter terreus]|uniref:Glycosyltransferase n=1 Tax=Adhaeribacter terreus TaxID=529703 RepID=A0ABW0E9X6_9BACT